MSHNKEPSDSLSPPYRNSYQDKAEEEPKDLSESTPLEEYDFNYLWDVRILATNRVQLRPFVVSLSIGVIEKAAKL